MAKSDENYQPLTGTLTIPDELIREFYRAAAVGGIIAREGESKPESILQRAFAFADEAIRLRKQLGE